MDEQQERLSIERFEVWVQSITKHLIQSLQINTNHSPTVPPNNAYEPSNEFEIDIA